MDKPGLRDALPQPRQSDTRNDPFWSSLDSSLSAASSAPPLSKTASARNLDVGLGDLARGVGAGALELVGGIGELAGQASEFGKENAGKQGGDYLEQARANMANKLSPVLDVVAGAGDLATSGSKSLNDGMSADAKEALGRRLVDETPEGRLTMGDGAGDLDVWAMKMAQGVGSMVPTLLAGGVTGAAAKASIGRAVTTSMLKRGATQEVAEAVAAKTVAKLATGAAVTTGTTGSVGSAGVNTRDTVLGMSFDELAASDTFRQSFTRIDQDQQTQHLSDEEKLSLAREETANVASRATMSDAKVWGAAAVGSMMGDAMLFKMLAGKAATGGVLKGTAKGAVGEGIGETLEEGVQQYAVNEALNEVAAADIDPMKGVMSSAIEGGLIGMGTGGAVGAVGGARGGKHASQEDGVGADPVAEPSALVTEDAAGPAVDPNFASAPLEDGEQALSASQAEGELNPLGPSASQFPGVFERDQRGILRVKGDVDALASWAEQADMPYITDGDGIAIPAKYAKQAEKAIKVYRPVAAEPMAEAAPADMLAFSQVDPIEHEPAIKRQGFVMRNGDGQSTGEPEPYVRPQSGDELLYESSANWQAGQPHAESAPVDLEALRKESAQRWRDGNKPEAGTPVRTEEDTEQALNALRAEGVNGWAGRQDPKLDMPKGQEFIPHGPQAGLPAVVGDGVQQAAGKAKGLPLSDTIFAGGPSHGGQADNTNYARPHLTRDQVDTSMGEQSTRDPRSPVAQSIEQAGSATDSVFGPLQTLRITRKGKPFATEKEAAMASRKGQEMPVPLNGGGFGVAEIAEVEQVKAAATTQSSAPQLDDISVTNPNQPSDQPAASVSAETVPAPSATAGEASQLAPAIDTGYREVIPGNQPQAEVSNEPVTPVPAISSEGQRDQPGAGEPAAAGAGPAVAGLTDRAGSGDRADLAAPAPVPDGQQQNDPTLTAPATDAGAAVSGRIGEEELRDRDLLKEHGGHWKYRSAVGAGWFTANTKEAAIERAEEAYRKAVSKGEAVPTRDERFAQADAELFSEMDRRYGKMSTPELEAEYQRLGGEVGDLQKSGSGEFNGNGGRRTGAAVSNEGARQVGEERLRLGVYMKMRRDRDTAGSGAKSQQIEPANDWRGAKSATDYHAAKRRLFSGEMEFSEFQAMSRSALDNAPSLRAELEKKTRQDLLDQMSRFNAARYKNDKKAVVVEAAYNQLIGDLRWAANSDGNTISETYAIGGARQSIEERVAKALDGLTPERYQQFVNKQRADVAKRDAELAATKEALRDPQTLEQFKTFLKYRSLDKLTPEQRARYEDLIAASNLDKRDQAREVKAATAVTPTASGDIIKTKHTKSGEDLFVVQMGDRVDRDTYNQINAHAKKLGGWYSSYKVGGAVPGFQFKDEAKATEFRGWLTGQGAASAAPSAEAAPTEVTDPDQDNSKSKQVETLRTRAKTLRDKATAALNAERKENTNKRMTEAANARANAESELHFAGLLDAIADGIESGEVTYLRNLANGTQLTELNHALSRSLWNLPPARREALTSQGMIERTEDGRERWSAKATPEMMAEGAQMPGMDYFARNLKDVATKMQGASGFKQAGAKIMALVNAAINRDSKTVSITDPELIAKLKAYTSGVSDYDAKAVKEQIGGYSRLERMGITNHTELRAALRELARLQAGLKKQAVPRDPLAEKMVALKRKLVGNRNAFIDFFPTPESHAADLVALVGIEPGMTVLEPSAGHGMLAEAARAAGAKVDAVELAGDLREILQAKGFGLVGSDFMATTPAQSYDAVVMNPPFSNDMDIDHVRHAFAHLKPGGRLVAIVSATAGDRQNNKNKAFREWFDGLGGSEQAMPEGSFKASLNPTDVRTKIFVIDKPANEAKPLPSPEGKRVTVATPKGQSVEVQYRVMEADDLVASHDFEGNLNHDYPQQLQPRDRSKQTYRVQVGQIAAAPDGARLAASPETDRGAPIVRDGIVESGNGRTIGLKQAYQRGDAGAYRAYLLTHATEFGLDAAAIEAMSAPVLVRERLTEMDDQQLRDFVVDSNTDAKMANSATEDARADAGKLTTDMLNMLNIPEGGDVLAAQNHRFLQAFLRAIGENQSNSYVNQSGGWNAEYGKRVKAAIFAYGYDNQRLLDAVTGETDEVGRNMIAALLNNAVVMAQLRQRSPDRAKSLANYLAEAMESVIHNKRSGQSLQELAAQGDMLGGGPSSEAALLAQAMAANARSAKTMTGMIGDILAMMNTQPTSDMFGEAVPTITAEEAIRETLRAIDAYNQQRNKTPRPSGDLFGLAAPRNDHGTTPGVSGHRDGGATESAADQGLKAPKLAKEPEERHTVAGISFKVPVFDKELQKTFNEAVHRGEGRNFAQEIQTVANRLALDLEADGLLATAYQRALASQLLESWVEREIDNAKQTMAYGIANPSWMVTGTSGNPFSKRRQKSNLELENDRQADHEKAQEAAVKRMRAALKELQSPEAKRAEAFKLAWRDARTILRDLSSYLSQGKTALLAELRKSGAPKLAKLFDTMAESDPARHRSELQSQDQRFKEAGMPGLIALIGERTKAGKMLAELLGEEGQSPSQTPNSLRMSQQRIAAVARREGLSAHDVAEIVFDFRAEYKGARSLDFIVGQTQEDLYGPEGSPEQIGWNDGGYLPSKQQVHLIADSINRRARGKDLHEGGREERGVSGDPVLDNSVRPTLRSGPDAGGARAKAEVVSTLRHEVLGHYGLDTFTPDDKQHLLQKLIDAKNEKWIAPVWQQISGDSVYSKNSDLHQAEEVFAHIAEKALPSRTIQAWRDIKTELSRLLRKIGLVKGPIKEHELDSLIKAISKGIRNGERTRQNIRGDKQVIGKPTKAMTASEVEMVLTGWLKRYQGAGNIKVAVHATQAEMEQALGIDPQPGLVRRAAFDDDTTTLHIAANTISDPKRLNEISRHEVLAHYGLARTLGGKEFTKLLSRVINSRNNPSMKAVWDWVEANYDNEEIGVQAEEVIAHLAELEPSAWQRGWDRVVAWVMGALRSVGFAPGKVSASEIRSMIVALGRNMEGGPNGGPNGGKGKRNIRFSQSQGAGLAQGMAGRAKYQAGGVLDAVRNFLKQRRPLMLGTLTDLQIDQLYRDITGGAVSAYQRLRTKMEAERNDILLDAETRIDPLWDALEKQEKADLSSLMHDATMSRLHPDKPLDENSYYLEAKQKVERAKKPETKAAYEAELHIIERNHSELARQYQALTPKAKALYATMEQTYNQQWETLREAIEQRLVDLLGENKGRAMAATMRLKMESALKHGPYFPLTRFGDYVVKARKGDEYVREHFERRIDAEQAVKLYQRDGYNALMTVKEEGNGDSANAHQLGMELLDFLEEAEGVSKDQLQDTIWQAMLKMMPDASYAKHAIHRRRVKGASRDAHRAYMSSVYHFARHVSKIRYGHKMQGELDKLSEQVLAGVTGEPSSIKPEDLEIAQQVLNEMNKRHDMNMNPTGKAWAGHVGNAGFLYYIGPSLASAVVNMTQNFTVMLPQLGAKYGFAKSASAMTAAMGDYIKHGKFKAGTTEAWQSLTRSTTLKADELALLKELYRAGVLDLTQAHSVAAKADTDQQDAKVMSKHWRKAMRWAGATFHNAEVLNREVAALAAYRLLKEAEPTLSAEQYAEKVTEMVYDGHGNYAASNRPRYMRNDVVKVMTQFKIYSQMMTYVIYSNAIKAAKGDKQAAKTLGGIMAAHWVMAGVMGLPVPITWVAYALAAAADDDDDRSGEASFRLGLTEALGPRAGELLAKGPLDSLTNLSIAGRTGLNDLWWRSPKEGTEGDDLAWHAVQQLLGPVAGIGINLVRGGGQIVDGEIQRGLETVLPKAVRDTAKAYRQATEGEQTIKGDVIIDDVGAWNVVMQAAGFGSAQMAKNYDAREYIKAKEKRIAEVRSGLLKDYYNARKSGDLDEVKEVIERIKAFNAIHHPGERITGKSLALSFKSKLRSNERTQGGVYLNRNREYLREEGRFAD